LKFGDEEKSFKFPRKSIKNMVRNELISVTQDWRLEKNGHVVVNKGVPKLWKTGGAPCISVKKTPREEVKSRKKEAECQLPISYIFRGEFG